jgi:hypothetical protein
MSNEPRYTRVVISSNDTTTSRFMAGAPVGGLNEGVTNTSMGLLIPSPVPTTLPALTATVYFKDEAGFSHLVSPTPPILWELSCGQNVATIDSNGVITRQTNPNAQSFDSNGGVSTGQIGGLIQVSGTVLRGDGSKSGVIGTLNICIQNSSARQFAEGGQGNPDPEPYAANAPSAAGFYDLVQ